MLIYQMSQKKMIRNVKLCILTEYQLLCYFGINHSFLTAHFGMSSQNIQIEMLIKQRFEILKGYANNHVTIGFGSYGQVKLARDLQNGEVVAVKVINKIAKNQVMMHYGLSHPKVIKLLDVHIDSERQITYMILEYAEGGTLYDKIKMSSVSKQEIKKYFKDVCEALAYLHSENIMHRDIKPENILLTKNNEAKLCDFGFAAILGQRKTLCGTYQYMSPEMIQNRPYDYKIDIWAMGILLFELIAGHAPFKGTKPEQVLEQMKTKIYFCQRFDNEDIALIKSILRVTPHKRPSIEEILDNPYFKFDEKQEQSKSTANTEDSMKKNSNFQYLSESCNPKKIGELQKVLERQQAKQQIKEQKQTYPPFYVPKNTNKFAYGAPVPVKQVNEVKSYSPFHSTRPQQSNNVSVHSGSNHHLPQRPVHPHLPMNKTLANPQGKNLMMMMHGHGQTFGSTHPHSQNQSKPSGGFNSFGRFS